MIRRLLAVSVLAIPSVVVAQSGVGPSPIRVGATSGGSTITAGTTATSGCTDGGFLYSLTSLIRCGSLMVTDGANVITASIAGSSAANGSITINGTTSATKTTSYVLLQDTGGYVGIGHTAPTAALHLKGAGGNATAPISILESTSSSAFQQIKAFSGAAGTYYLSGATPWYAGLGAYTGGTGYEIANSLGPLFSIATTGATTIGTSSLGTSVVPLTVTPGTGSAANLLNLTNSAGTSLSYFDSSGDLFLPTASGYIKPKGFTASYLRLSDSAGTYLAYGSNSIVMGISSTTLSGPSSTATLNSSGFVLGQNGINTTFYGNGGTVPYYSSMSSSTDLLFAPTTGITRLGVNVNGAAVNQTLKAHDGITGTDISGANLTIAAGRGTGSGAGGSLIFQTAPVGSTGTTAQTLATRMTIQKDGGITLAGVVYANLGTPADGTLFYCSDCKPTTAFVDSTCTNTGTGSLAIRLNGAWKCNN